MTLTLVLDGLIVVFLAAMIGFCVLLNKRLAALRRAQSELAQFAAALNDATGHAEAGVKQLKAVAESLGKDLEAKIETARTVSDDLSFMARHGGSVADRLELSLKRAQAPRPAGVAQGPARSQAERDLVAALRAAR
jgi:Flp pilus assembly protein TadB